MKKVFLLLLTFFFAQMMAAQSEWQVSGVVTDSKDGLGIPGVTVMVQGLQTGAMTDVDGRYSIKVLAGRSLRFTSVGYKEVTRVVNGNATINVAMEINATMLNEVVAIGYGTMKKSDLTGAVASVKADALKKTPAAGLDQALQGRVAGVAVNANSGQPGEKATIRIRGIGSAIGGSDPIYVVDGVITDNINFLSPNDIQSTEVLKDASATAIYGSRGANGVIIVTTRNGSNTNGKANIALDVYWGVQNRWRKLDLMNSKDMVETKLRIGTMRNGAEQIDEYSKYGFNEWLSLFQTAKSPFFPVVKTAKNPNGFDYSSVDTDWQDEVFNSNAFMHNYNLSIDGGSEHGKYAFSSSYFNQDGTIIGSNYERLTLRFNSEFQARKWLKIGEHISFMTSQGRNAMHNSSSPGASVISAALAMAPWDPTHYADGSSNLEGKDLSGQISASSNFKNVTNPFSMVKHTHPQNNTERLIGDVYAELSLAKGLTLRSSVSLDLSMIRNRNFKDAYQYSSFDKDEKNFISSEIARYSTLMGEAILTYAKEVGKHNFSLMAGQTIEEYNFYRIGGSGANITNPTPNNWYLHKATEEQTYAGDGEVSRVRRNSFLGRTHYSYNDRYLVTVSFRADGSSKFPENSWGFFPSTALAWRISEEEFMQGFDNLDALKLRFGWGQVGNDAVRDNAFSLTMGSSENVFYGYPFGPGDQALQTGASVLTYVNKNGKWETNEQWNIGLDFGLFRGAISGTIDVFRRDTKDALLYVESPAHVGNRYPLLKNVGVIRNEGIELNLEHQNTIGKINYSIGGNASIIRNELVALNGGSAFEDDKVINNIGLPLRTFWGFEYQGVYTSDQQALEHLYSYTAETIGLRAGDAKYADIVKNGKIENDDRTNLGNPFPKLTYGLNLGLDAYGFDMQMFFQGVYGNKIYNALRLRTEGAGAEATLSTDMTNVWVGYTDPVRGALLRRGVDWSTLENRNGTIPNPLGAPTNSDNSSRFIEDGSYFRLKNLQIGYTLPRQTVEKIQVSRCRIYVSANNLLTLTKYTGYDPEISSGVDYGNYPQSRTYMCGVNISF